jgi:hypothetical protein
LIDRRHRAAVALYFEIEGFAHRFENDRPAGIRQSFGEAQEFFHDEPQWVRI